MGKRIAYKNVSCFENKADMQLEDMTFDVTFEERVCVGNDRPELNKMLLYIQHNVGSHVYVHEMSCLSPTMLDIYHIIEVIRKLGASITFVKEQISFEPEHKTDQEKKALFGMESIFAGFEYGLTKRRY